MKTRWVASTVVLCLACWIAAAAQEKAKPVSVSGAWQASVKTDQGSGNPSFEFTQDGKTLTGTYKGLFGRSTVDGTVDGNAIKFSFKARSPLNPLTKLQITYSGVIDPKSMTMKGTVDFGGQGTGTWTAKRPAQ